MVKIENTMLKHKQALQCSMLGKELQDEYILKKGLRMCQECINEYQDFLKESGEINTIKGESILDIIVYLEKIIEDGNVILKSKTFRLDENVLPIENTPRPPVAKK